MMLEETAIDIPKSFENIFQNKLTKKIAPHDVLIGLERRKFAGNFSLLSKTNIDKLIDMIISKHLQIDRGFGPSPLLAIHVTYPDTVKVCNLTTNYIIIPRTNYSQF